MITALAMSALLGQMRAAQPYAIIDTGQVRCYDNRNEIAPPKRGQPFYGQDAQFQGHPASYTLSPDGLTVLDRATGLTGSKADSGKGMNWRDALAWVQKKNAGKFLGHDDWRLTSVKELTTTTSALCAAAGW
jgi:hypothetical protein